MKKPFEIHLSIPEHWDFIGPTCTYIKNLLGCFIGNDKNVLSSAEIITDELIANVIKYSDHQSGVIPTFGLSISNDKKSIVFQSSNPIDLKSEHSKEIKHTLDMLHKAKNPGDAFFQRLTEQGAKQSGPSQLGILRIAFDGPCDIDARIDEQSILHITATMHL